MTLFEQIKADSLTARKNRDTPKVTLLVTLVGEIDSVAKNAGRPGQATDAEATAVVKKFLKGVDEVLKVDPTNAQALVEKPLLEGYLPKQLSEDQLRELIVSFIAGGANNIGMVQKRLKEQVPGQYDGALAAKVAQSVLNSGTV